MTDLGFWACFAGVVVFFIVLVSLIPKPMTAEERIRQDLRDKERRL